MRRRQPKVLIPRGCPAHLRERTHILRRLQDWANGMRTLFGATVWLCGSALEDTNTDPRDWDIRITLSDRAFALRYGGALAKTLRVAKVKGRRPVVSYEAMWRWIEEGGSGRWSSIRWRWSDEMVRQSLKGSAHTGLVIDLQVYPRKHVWIHGYDEKPRMRLDTRWARCSRS